MEEKYIRINTVLQPSKETSQKIAVISQEIAKSQKAYFILDNKNYYPHITVYSPEYPEDKLGEIISKIEDLSQVLSKIELKFKGLITNQGYIGLDFDNSVELKKIHENIVQTLNPLRDNHLRDKYQDDDYKMKLSPEKIANIAKYGYPDAMELYHPHMTIIRLEDPIQAEEIAKSIDWHENIIIDKLALYKMGEHGTCTELIKEFKFK